MLDSLHKNHYVFLLGDFNVDLSHDAETDSESILNGTINAN